jgi:hypothetical protein
MDQARNPEDKSTSTLSPVDNQSAPSKNFFVARGSPKLWMSGENFGLSRWCCPVACC